jgi:hypothetical protein
MRTGDGFVENFGSALIARISSEAPGVRLRFLPKPDKDSTPLRDGPVDLETGVVGKAASPELRVQALFSDRFIGVVRMGQPLSQGEIGVAAYASGRHIRVSRRGQAKVLRCLCPHRRSWCHCSGTRGYMPMPHIAGCAAACGTSAPARPVRFCQ